MSTLRRTVEDRVRQIQMVRYLFNFNVKNFYHLIYINVSNRLPVVCGLVYLIPRVRLQTSEFHRYNLFCKMKKFFISNIFVYNTISAPFIFTLVIRGQILN